MAKFVMILGSVPIAGAIHYAFENPLRVTDAVADRLFRAGVLAGEPVDAGESTGEMTTLAEPWLDEPGETVDVDGNGVPDGYDGETVTADASAPQVG